MIAFLKGNLAGKTSSMAYLNVQGVGYAVGMSQASLSKLPETGSVLKVHTYLQVREDGVSLFGFLSLEEKALFEQLISVSGVGPKVALAALSVFAPSALVSAISAQDVTAVQKIPGVGKKTASRIILELKGSLDQDFASLFAEESHEGRSSEGLKDATEALLSMGFAPNEVELALKDAPQAADEVRLIQYALKRLGA